MRSLSRLSAGCAALAVSAALLVSPASAASVPPTAVDDVLALPVAAPAATVDVLANDRWTGTPVLALARGGQPGAAQHGAVEVGSIQVSGAPRPALLYTPDARWFGVDTFTYTLTDGTGQSAQATVTATTAPTPPTAGPDAASTPPGVQVRIPVLGNDDDPYGRDLAVASVADPRRGSAVVDGGRDVLYTPDAGWTGRESFTYVVASSSGATAQGTITVTTLDATPGHSITVSATPSVVVQRFLGFTGRVDPAAGGPVTVSVQRLTATGWKPVLSTAARADGRWYVGFRPYLVGTITWRVRAVWADGSSAVVRTASTIRSAADPKVSGPLTRSAVPFSFRNGCPVGPSQLRLLSVNYWAYDGTVKRGSIVLRTSAVPAVRAVFAKAYQAKFRFKVIKPVDYFYAGGRRTPSGSDIAAMNAGNTSAFNCRPVTGNRYRISQHSFGNAIDVNTFENPYVTWSHVYPAKAEYPYYRFRAQNLRDHGVISASSVVARSFRALGWVWGGRWSPPDYQHFSSNGG